MAHASFQDRQRQEAEVMPLVVAFLEAKPGTLSVVGATSEQQRHDDIDLIWARELTGSLVVRSVEVKVDSQISRTGNFAFETISNELRQTPGCFVRSRAHWLIYACSVTLTAWVMPLEVVRAWFVAEMTSRPSRFRTFETFTKVNDGIYYSSLGRLVAVEDLEHSLGDWVQKVSLK